MPRTKTRVVLVDQWKATFPKVALCMSTGMMRAGAHRHKRSKYKNGQWLTDLQVRQWVSKSQSVWCKQDDESLLKSYSSGLILTPKSGSVAQSITVGILVHGTVEEFIAILELREWSAEKSVRGVEEMMGEGVGGVEDWLGMAFPHLHL
ncbi:hypothetical protein EI94DRAFT_1707272 [Lactarius quietus]|nr:hypothetical protein EI94DRAFT_1707272 [Lactarius quietus]